MAFTLGAWVVSFLAVWCALIAFTFRQLATMDVEHLPAAAGAVLAIMVAFTSLMYNRARAYKDGTDTNYASLQAAEMGLQSTVYFIFGVALTIAFFMLLGLLGYTKVAAFSAIKDYVPAVAALGPLALFIRAGMRATAAMLLFLKFNEYETFRDIERQRRTALSEQLAVKSGATLTVDAEPAIKEK